MCKAMGVITPIHAPARGEDSARTPIGLTVMLQPVLAEPASAPLPVRDARAISAAELAHIPAHRGLPVLGSLPEIAWDPMAFARRMLARHGPIYRFYASGRWNVQAIGPEANEAVLFDREGIYSGEGWRTLFGRFMPQATLLLDGDPHRAARRVLGAALKPAYVAGYRAIIDAEARRFADRIAGETVDLYPETRRLMLSIAISAFLGEEFDDQERKIRCFDDLMRAMASPISLAVAPRVARGLAARRELEAMLRPEVPRRAAGEGRDIFSRICQEGEGAADFDADMAVGQMIFLLTAAHDAMASISTSAMFLLASHPEWQARLRGELLMADLAGSEATATPLTDAFIYETIRFHPPTPVIWRQAVRDTQLLGKHIPAGTAVSINPITAHRLPAYFPDPERFDPLRHVGDLARVRNRFAFVPFGGGVHMCLGLHFAMMEMRLVLRALLERGAIRCPSDEIRWHAWPTWRPVTPVLATLAGAQST